MNLWIIYKEGIIISKIIAEMLQDLLEDYINVSVGNAKKIEPSVLLEEKCDYLIIGDLINEEIPSFEIKSWILKFKKIFESNNQILRAISSYNIILSNHESEKLSFEFLEKNIKSEIFYPPILFVNLTKIESLHEIGELNMVKKFSKDIIDLLKNHS